MQVVRVRTRGCEEAERDDVEADVRRTPVWDSNRRASNQPLEKARVASALRGSKPEPECEQWKSNSRNSQAENGLKRIESIGWVFGTISATGSSVRRRDAVIREQPFCGHLASFDSEARDKGATKVAGG